MSFIEVSSQNFQLWKKDDSKINHFRPCIGNLVVREIQEVLLIKIQPKIQFFSVHTALMSSIKVSIDSSNLVKKTNPMRSQSFRSLVQNVDSPKTPKSPSIFDSSRSSNSYFSVIKGLNFSPRSPSETLHMWR